MNAFGFGMELDCAVGSGGQWAVDIARGMYVGKLFTSLLRRIIKYPKLLLIRIITGAVYIPPLVVKDMHVLIIMITLQSYRILIKVRVPDN